MKFLIPCLLMIFLFFSCRNDDDGDPVFIPAEFEAEIVQMEITLNGLPFEADLGSIDNSVSEEFGNLIIVIYDKENTGLFSFSIYDHHGVDEYPLSRGFLSSTIRYTQFTTDTSPQVSWLSDFGSIQILMDDGSTIVGSFEFRGTNTDQSIEAIDAQGTFELSVLR